MDDPAIAILPYGLTPGPRLAQMALSELIWPLGCPDRLRGGRLSDLDRRDHLIIYPRTSAHFRLRRGTRARISLLMGEPSVIHARHIALLRLTHRRFFRVMTFNEDLIARIPNGVFLPFGTTWVPDWRDLQPEKTRTCSLIASAKRDTAGHRLRHAVADWVRATGQDVEIMGRGYTPFRRKSDGLAPFRYSVVIENMREPNYFSEKLLDAVFCETVPIYWGCPNIDRFADPSAMIRCQSEDDIRRAVAAMSPADYAARLPALRALAHQLAAYVDIEARAARALRAELGS